MKQKALKMLALFMALNVLFSATGFALFEHTCHSLGLTTHSLDNDFCEMESVSADLSKELSFNQSPCCETHSDFQNIDVESGISFHPILISSPAVISSQKSFFSESPIQTLSENNRLIQPSKAPPESGRKILIKIQTFLI